MMADLNKSARCFGLFVNGQLTTFGGVLYRPHPKVRDVRGLSRLVTLPDWQGLGLAMILAEKLGAAYRAVGERFHTYPAHPSLVRSFMRSQSWRMIKKAGDFSRRLSKTCSITGTMGGRPCAAFQYVGPALSSKDSWKLLERTAA
jgi:hypothetical protein